MVSFATNRCYFWRESENGENAKGSKIKKWIIIVLVKITSGEFVHTINGELLNYTTVNRGRPVKILTREREQ